MVFLFSSFTALPDRYFHGYAFCGSDFVSGPGGAVAYSRATGAEITGGLDGAYLSLWSRDGKHRFAVDYSGYKKVFFYSRGRVWGVSNSVTRLAEHLKANGVELSPDWVQMRSLRVENTVTAQLSSFHTIISDIRLLPSHYELEVSDGAVSLVRRPTASLSDYRDGLKCFIERWVARLETLLTDSRTQLTCDLTGGNDSRLVFGLLMKAQERLGFPAGTSVSIRSGTASRWKRDLEAATTVAAHYGVKLNQPVSRPAEWERYGSYYAYRSWKDLNLCAYFPVYFAPRDGSSFALHLHGGGGENHRAFYPYESFEHFAERMLPPYPAEDALLEYWVGSVGESIRELRRESPGVNDWILHYREFRSRLHGGRAPQYRNVISPLASREMEQLSNIPGKSDNAQVHFDVMASLSRELIHFPYDDPRKAPSPRVLRNLTTVGIESRSAPGSCYIEPSRCRESRDGSSTELDMLLSDFHEANTPEVCDLMPDILKKALVAAKGVEGQKRFDHASDAKNISRVMSAAFVLTRL